MSDVTTLGIPLPGSFNQPDAPDASLPSGVHNPAGWCVNSAINAVQAEVIFGDRTVKAYKTRPHSYDDMFRASVERNPDGKAVVCGTRRLTYAQLDKLVQHVASGFMKAGLDPGGRVAVMLDNCLEFLVAVLACVRASGIAVPLGTRLGPADVAYIVSNAEPVIVVTSKIWQDRFPLQSSVKRTYLVGPSEGDDSFAILTNSPGMAMPALKAEDTMMIIYTSGTTGKPKGACLTHVNFVHTCLHYLYALAIDKPQRSLLVIPVTHIAGFGPVLSVTLASAGTVVMMREFKPSAVLEAIATERITYTVLVPAMYQLCAIDPGFSTHDLSCWNYGIYGGAIMPPAVIERFANGQPTLRMINAYGATETCAVCTIIPPELTATAPSSVGLPLECDEILIVNEEGHEVELGQVGELLVRGPNVIPGYWRDAAATERSFINGFWKSGDLGSRDPNGLIYIHDRLKDMINRGGFKVFSAEVENALMAHPDVVDCAVVGVPHLVLGEKTFAFVQRKKGSLESGELKKFLNDRIADYKVPDYWHVVDESVPRNQNGKLQKAVIRELAISQAGRTTS